MTNVSKFSPQSPERHASPEDQAMILIENKIANAARRLLTIVPEIQQTPSEPPVQRVVSSQAMSPTVERALTEPTLEDQARNSLREIHGVDNDHQAAA